MAAPDLEHKAKLGADCSNVHWAAAGVIPIDRLTEVRSPLEVVVRKAGVRALEDAYNVRLPRPTAAEQQDRSACSAALCSVAKWPQQSSPTNLAKTIFVPDMSYHVVTASTFDAVVIICGRLMSAYL